ncbi:SDR family NAD(P)-dependent oxidoreductase [Caulobacter mirabilis]|uniref:NAD-dependent oxidoreductase n=1 Tax=Caulobacter mirabilis TaxID=69666 RepID=A0A2D2B055_9CAUL|nr:SDR family NAD(P)-dependent oxidoreductase [Caulobacter mirabilis]ATQ43633.1 NAD-dependent oxidoreductase [Caulobacter mirabilis]
MSGRVFAVTGGFGILGSAVGRAALADGARVALIDAAPAPAGLPEGVLALGGVDLTSTAQAEAALAKVVEAFGGLDVLVNVAGGFRWQTLQDGDLDVWGKLYALNTATCATTSKAALPHLLASKAGRIVSVGANGAVKAVAGMGAYAASKAGVHRLTESLAEELKGRVTVNAVLPSIIDTPANRADMPGVDPSTWVTADEVAQAILWLASEQASGVTGALLPVVGRV